MDRLNFSIGTIWLIFSVYVIVTFLSVIMEVSKIANIQTLIIMLTIFMLIGLHYGFNFVEYSINLMLKSFGKGKGGLKNV